MNDRELLGLAAKAAGIEMGGTFYSDGSWSPYTDQSFKPSSGIGGGLDVAGWNPLEDDGDALRLAVRLGLEVQTKMGPYGDIVTIHHEELGDSLCERHGNDQCAAARRAIVRAAAGIGKAKGEA